MKNPLHHFFLLSIFLSSLITNTALQAQSASSKETIKWYNSLQWLNGLQLKPHSSVNKEEFAKQYHAAKAWWDKGFAYLKETDLAALKPGRYPIDGDNVYALVTEAPAKELDKANWEGHRNYLDIHYVPAGKEKIGIAPVAEATLTKEYDSKRDIAFYASKGEFYTSNPGIFFISTTMEIHCPGMKENGYDTIKQVVIKIRKK